MSYKYELHCHTREVSACSSASAAYIVKKYKKAGYDGVVITDHFSGLSFPAYNYHKHKKNAQSYLNGYKAALEAAGDDFTVLLGMEIRFLLTTNDYLVYGIDENFVKNMGNFLYDTQKSLYKKVKDAGALLIQAHPFRKFVKRADPRYLDGVEVYNGKAEQAANDNSLSWAKDCGFKIFTSGSDHHHAVSKISGGIETQEKIRTNADLLRILRSGEYKLIGESGTKNG